MHSWSHWPSQHPTNRTTLTKATNSTTQHIFVTAPQAQAQKRPVTTPVHSCTEVVQLRARRLWNTPTGSPDNRTKMSCIEPRVQTLCIVQSVVTTHAFHASYQFQTQAPHAQNSTYIDNFLFSLYAIFFFLNHSFNSRFALRYPSFVQHHALQNICQQFHDMYYILESRSAPHQIRFWLVLMTLCLLKLLDLRCCHFKRNNYTQRRSVFVM